MSRKTVYNKYVTDEKWEQVNEVNKDLIDDFVDYLRTTDHSEKSIVTYVSDLKIFFYILYVKM